LAAAVVATTVGALVGFGGAGALVGATGVCGAAHALSNPPSAPSAVTRRKSRRSMSIV
jgi:hypothetical protein